MTDSFARRKMRWLNKVMYDTALLSTDCRVAFVLMDFQNRATRDSWLAQQTIARKIGTSVKTVQRSVSRLEKKGFLKIQRFGREGKSNRYALELPYDDDCQDADVSSQRHGWPSASDSGVSQSYSNNLQISSLAGRRTKYVGRIGSDRGRFELEIAARIGSEGIEILNRLAEIDDRHVAAVCEQQRNGTLTDLDIQAILVAVKGRRA